MSEYIFKCLESALDCGISEADFWQMTLAEIKRAIESKIRTNKTEAQQKAIFDYVLATLIGKNVERLLSTGDVTMPTLEEVYPSLFVDKAKAREEEKAIKQAELSAARFRQYANFHNTRFSKEVANVK